MNLAHSIRNLVALASVASCLSLAQTSPPITSAEPTVFQTVTAKLDPGGSLYGYLSTDRWLARLSEEVGELRSFVLAIPGLEGEQRDTVERVFKLVEGLVKRSGIESLAGAGLSAIAIEKGLYRTRFVLQRAPGASADGYLWQWFGRQAHPWAWQSWLPADTVYALSLDVDLQAIWSAARQEAETAGLEPLQEGFQEVSNGVQEVTGASLADHLASFGGELGVALVLDPIRTFKLPLGAAGGASEVELPEPSLVLALKVKDDKLFNVLDTLLKEHPESKTGEGDGARWRSIPVPAEAPFPFTPTIARAGDYLWVTSTDILLKQILRVKKGEVPVLSSTDEFKRLARNLPTQGNSFAFVSRRFSEAMMRLQTAAFAQAAQAGGPPAGLMQRFMGLAATPSSYAVGWPDSDGAQSVSQGTQEPTSLIVGATLAAPVAVLAGITLPALTQAKGKAQQIQCMNNLKQIALGMMLYASDNEDKFPPDFKSLDQYLGHSTRVLVCPQDPAGMPDSGAWADFDFTKCSYEYLKPGLKLNTLSSPATTPIARCKFHGTQAYADGHVQRP